MPELPDITVYLEALGQRVVGQVLNKVRVRSPFLLRTATPALEQTYGRTVVEMRRLGKRIALGLDEQFWLVFHLMIAGRLHWIESPSVTGQTRDVTRASPAAKTKSKALRMAEVQAEFEFDRGRLMLTEAGTKRRASLHVVQGEAALAALNPGGLEVLSASLDEFSRALRSENHTLKRALTDPRLFSGIGNAYSDEILHRAGLSPVMLSQKLAAGEVERLYQATQKTLTEWINRLRAETGAGFPEKVTAFRPEMAVHGKFGQPCPVCGTKVQRIRYAENETNYCPGCQTGGRLLADRSLSLLLKQDWPGTVSELEERKGRTAHR
ncbi:MAG TPA: DNA-formamidopyrimidine glycosylase family protein [Verrucomicrobiae bacterium]|nr:DNA-formamidopyrimidine glycosylase family protein [Verrucomicrobiae bacterium]